MQVHLRWLCHTPPCGATLKLTWIIFQWQSNGGWGSKGRHVHMRGKQKNPKKLMVKSSAQHSHSSAPWLISQHMAQTQISSCAPSSSGSAVLPNPAVQLQASAGDAFPNGLSSDAAWQNNYSGGSLRVFTRDMFHRSEAGVLIIEVKK